MSKAIEMGKFTERKRLRLARIVMVRSALREHCSVLIALDAPPHLPAPHHLSLALLTFPHWSLLFLLLFFSTSFSFLLTIIILCVRANFVHVLFHEWNCIEKRSKRARTMTFRSSSFQSFFSFLVCFLQFAPYFVAGAVHPDGCWQ